MPLGHVEVDAAFDRSGERSVRAEALSETQGPSRLFDVEHDTVGQLLESSSEVPQKPDTRRAQYG